jgi:hypothetical protein
VLSEVKDPPQRKEYETPAVKVQLEEKEQERKE